MNEDKPLGEMTGPELVEVRKVALTAALAALRAGEYFIAPQTLVDMATTIEEYLMRGHAST